MSEVGFVTRYFQKNYEWIILNIPVFFSVILLFNNTEIAKELISYSGYVALSMLILVLSLNPLVRIFPKIMFLKIVNRRRRIIGVAAFTYGLVHASCFVIKKGSIEKIIPLLKYPVIMAGLFTLFIFLLLSITSNNYSVKKLGLRKWKRLHKLVYLTQISLAVHLFFLKHFLLIGFSLLPLVILQIIRFRKNRVV